MSRSNGGHEHSPYMKANFEFMNMKKLFCLAKTVFVLLGFSIACAYGGIFDRDLSVSCIGPEDATTFVVYLHGMDYKNPGMKERMNRIVLEEIARTQKIRIAVPRSDQYCGYKGANKERCWTWGTPETPIHVKLWPKIIRSRTKCFSKDKKFGIIGFSNGGYLLNQWVRDKCLKPEVKTMPEWLIAVGSARGRESALSEDSLHSEKCPPIIHLVGHQDLDNQGNGDTNEPSDPFAYVNALKQRGAKILDQFTFDGGHKLDVDSLSKALNKITSSLSAS
jgi:hypothetical protein